jgi:hypothetical protein
MLIGRKILLTNPKKKETEAWTKRPDLLMNRSTQGAGSRKAASNKTTHAIRIDKAALPRSLGTGKTRKRGIVNRKTDSESKLEGNLTGVEGISAMGGSEKL